MALFKRTAAKSELAAWASDTVCRLENEALTAADPVEGSRLRGYVWPFVAFDRPGADPEPWKPPYTFLEVEHREGRLAEVSEDDLSSAWREGVARAQLAIKQKAAELGLA